jgi:diadenosine tetraphosphatase ApaH/serine/threonine PP2A family protein phosphatase
MRLAIISDIHSNLPALEAVLEAIEGSDAEEVWCLGDVVGYGAQPDECASVVAERCPVSLVGNHDLAVLGEIEVSAFSPAAAEAVKWTRENASADTLDYLRGLEPKDESREVGLYHASPRDPVWEYVLWTDQAEDCIAAQSGRVSLIGHSHVALYFVSPEGDREVRGAHAEGGTRLELGHGRWLVNPGSVGQPRDGDPRAAWLELDTESWTATYHRLEYPIDRAAEAITEAGLPEHLAARLFVGQ